MSAKDFPARLIRLRKAKGLSQVQLAALVEMHQSTISDYERGDTRPGLESMLSLSGALGVSLDELVRGKNSEKISK
jgi:transcriptional regulator with XRE-family HTH domain